MTAALLFREPAQVDADAGPDQCAGIFVSRSTGRERPCTAVATFEALRTCHGEIKPCQVCDAHADDLRVKPGSLCGTCDERTVRLIALVPIGGAA